MAKRVLIIKTTSLGDVVHMLPALSDAASEYPDIIFDWVVERPFAEVPTWHRHVNHTIPVDIRRWRKRLVYPSTWCEIKSGYQDIRKEKYDYVVDSQGLLKSSVLAKVSCGASSGYDKNSIKEPIASLLYDNKVTVSTFEHAITRNRKLLANVLGYDIDNKILDYGISNISFIGSSTNQAKGLVSTPYIMALHGTSREDKEWPFEVWDRFLSAKQFTRYNFLFPWGNDREHERALALKEKHRSVIVLPKCSLNQLADLILGASAVVGMDTGLMHIAAALNQKGIALYPATQPKLTGVRENGGANYIKSLEGCEALNLDSVIAKVAACLDY